MPEWVEQSRRLGGLLIGVSTSCGRPISLAKEWEPIARRLLKAHADGDLEEERLRERAAEHAAEHAAGQAEEHARSAAPGSTAAVGLAR